MARQIYVNLPVANVERTRAFFTALGFSFEPKFSNEQGICMIVADDIFVMLLETSFFKSFTDKAVADANATCEVMIAISCESRAEVESLVEKAKAAGAKTPRPPQDLGFMFSQAFEDLDGHYWEPVYMDPNAEAPAG